MPWGGSQRLGSAPNEESLPRNGGDDTVDSETGDQGAGDDRRQIHGDEMTLNREDGRIETVALNGCMLIGAAVMIDSAR